MARRALSFLAATAAMTAFGGLHLDLATGGASDRPVRGSRLIEPHTPIAVTVVNRTAKGDRNTISPSTTSGHTITFQHPVLPTTSIAVRIWETVGTSKLRPASQSDDTPTAAPKPLVACESVVSVLADVEKRLAAGRCVT